jgi:adenosylcobinamide-GDP ribazoletransferase
MSAIETMRGAYEDFLSAVRFLTRVPVPSGTMQVNALASAVKFFPFIGLIIGGCAALIHHLLVPHLSRLVSSALLVACLVAVTGCLHEDGLADAADGFGGGWNKEQILRIFRDSNIGSYGATVLSLSLLLRVVLIAAIPLEKISAYLIASQILCRWTTLPLSYYLPSARSTQGADHAVNGLGASIARFTTLSTLIWGSFYSVVLVILVLRTSGVAPILCAVGLTFVTARYYWSKINGVTGDCFGATNQLTEVAVYLCGAWVV